MCEKLLGLAVRQDVKQSEEVTADSPRCRHNGGQEKEVARVVVIRIRVKFLLNRLIQSTINRLVGWLAIASEVRLRPHIPVELMAQGRIDNDVPDASKLKIFDPEVGLLEPATVGHMLALGNISSLLETLLNGSEEVLMGIVRGASVLLTAVQVISKLVNDEVTTWTSFMAVFTQVRDIQTKVLTVVGGPVLLHLLLVEAMREGEACGLAERVQPCIAGPGDLLAVGRLTVGFLSIGHGILQK
jgi:hypothetical protein